MKTKTGFIYLIANQINGKVYVGQTWRGVAKRWSGHRRESGPRSRNYLHKAMWYYGKDNFIVETLDEAQTQEDLNRKEILWIALFNSANREYGYNLTLGGSPGIPNEETRLKMSQTRKGRKKPPGAEEKRIASWKVNLDADPSRRERMSEFAKNLWANPEFRRKTSASLLKSWSDPEIKKKRLEKCVGIDSSKAISLWSNPDYVAKQLKSRRKKRKDDMPYTIKRGTTYHLDTVVGGARLRFSLGTRNCDEAKHLVTRIFSLFSDTSESEVWEELKQTLPAKSFDKLSISFSNPSPEKKAA